MLKKIDSFQTICPLHCFIAVIYLRHMKKAAAIFLFLFAFVQAAPAVCSIFTETGSVFVMDEEKGEDKTESEKKDKKDFISFTRISGCFSHDVNTAIHLAEKIRPFPCLEKLTPPPNFC